MLAYDYPLLGAFWTMLIIFFSRVTLIMILFRSSPTSSATSR